MLLFMCMGLILVGCLHSYVRSNVVLLPGDHLKGGTSRYSRITIIIQENLYNITLGSHFFRCFQPTVIVMIVFFHICSYLVFFRFHLFLINNELCGIYITMH